MDKGIYCLVFENPGCVVRVCALGEIAFMGGWHIYIGSALGSGGLKRLMRHISIALNHDRKPKWHIDYLLTSSFFSLDYTVYGVTGNRLECRLANMLNENHVPAFGSSDCSCPSHLLYRQGDPQREILAAFRKLRLDPVIKTIINPQVEDNI
jgi:Uri superfamily endonuclease